MQDPEQDPEQEMPWHRDPILRFTFAVPVVAALGMGAYFYQQRQPNQTAKTTIPAAPSAARAVPAYEIISDNATNPPSNSVRNVVVRLASRPTAGDLEIITAKIRASQPHMYKGNNITYHLPRLHPDVPEFDWATCSNPYGLKIEISGLTYDELSMLQAYDCHPEGKIIGTWVSDTEHTKTWISKTDQGFRLTTLSLEGDIDTDELTAIPTKPKTNRHFSRSDSEILHSFEILDNGALLIRLNGYPPDAYAPSVQ